MLMLPIDIFCPQWRGGETVEVAVGLGVGKGGEGNRRVWFTTQCSVIGA